MRKFVSETVRSVTGIRLSYWPRSASITAVTSTSPSSLTSRCLPGAKRSSSKRTVDVVYTPAELAKPRESPFGETNGDLKRGLELGLPAYQEIDAYCRSKGIAWTASCWDEGSRLHRPVRPAVLQDRLGLPHRRRTASARAKGKPIVLSTGMSTVEQVDHAVEVLGTDDWSSSTRAAPIQRSIRAEPPVIATLHERYGIPIGYSGHETGIASSVAAAVLGACIVERHVTLDRSLWGSDHAASLEPNGIIRVIRDIGSSSRRLVTAQRPFSHLKCRSCRSCGGSGSERVDQGRCGRRRWRPDRWDSLARWGRQRDQAHLLRGRNGCIARPACRAGLRADFRAKAAPCSMSSPPSSDHRCLSRLQGQGGGPSGFRRKAPA